MVSTILLVGSATWVAALTLWPTLQANVLFLAGTFAWLLVNCVNSLMVLIRQKRFALLLNLLQILVFALAHCQLFQVLGQGAYQAEREPQLFDWQLFAWAHAASAADL